MKKICIISQCSLPIPTTKGGAVETLVEYIIKENEKNHKFDFTIISIKEKEAEEISKNYKYTKFVYINPKNKYINKCLLFIYKILKHLKIYIPFTLEFKEALRKLKELKDQDYFIYEAGPTTQIPLLNKIIPKEKLLVHIHWDGMGNKKINKCFSYLIPVSNYIGDRWIKATRCNSSKIKVLQNCAKIERFTKKITESEKEELRAKLNIPKSNKVIIFTGRIVAEKGVKELLNAFTNLQEKDVTLMIIGSANFGAETNTTYEKEIDKIISNCKKSIIFTGFIHQTELYKYYSIADVAVIPSLFQDPAPLVCIETQATETPLIATRVGGIPEYTNKESTILIEADENIENNLTKEIDKLLKDEQLRKTMSKTAKQNSLKYNTSTYFKNFTDIIDSIKDKR